MPPAPSIARVARLALVVADPDASARFFVAAFDAKVVARAEPGEALAHLMGLPGAKIAETRLSIGDQEVALLSFDPPGRPYPPGSTSSDLWFQHFAIIVSDMGAAYAQLQLAGGFIPISEDGPQKLPESSGGVTAFKFRDAEGHPLELLEFPAGGGPDVWQAMRDRALFLGIDHSAIAVGDTARTIVFLQRAFGLEQTMQSENVGPEQARMDAVAGARVTVTGMAPRQTPPHVELLGYHVGARRPIDAATAANDIAATHFVLETDDIGPIVDGLTAAGARFVSPGVVALDGATEAVMVLDPDGHRFVVEAKSPSARSGGAGGQ